MAHISCLDFVDVYNIIYMYVSLYNYTFLHVQWLPPDSQHLHESVHATKLKAENWVWELN